MTTLKDKTTKEISRSSDIIFGFIIGILIISSFLLGNFIQNSGMNTINFCREHYNNETFLNTMITQGQPTPKQCEIFKDQMKLWINSPENKPFYDCLKYNTSEEQMIFRDKCFWGGPDWRILLFSSVFKWFFPITLIGIFITSIISVNKMDKEYDK